MAELVRALKVRFDKIYKETEEDGWCDDRRVNDYNQIKKLVEEHVHKINFNDSAFNLLCFMDNYNYEYIFMVLLKHGYKFTNMITLFNFFFYLNYRLVELNKSALLLPALDSLFNNEIIQYFGKEIIITDDDIDGILVENNKNILVREEPIDIENIFYNIKLLFDLSDTLTKDIYWEKIVLNYEERVNKSYKINSKEWLELSEHKKVLEKYRDTNYKLKYPIFKLEFVKYKKHFDDYLSIRNYIYDKTTNQIIYTKNNL